MTNMHKARGGGRQRRWMRSDTDNGISWLTSRDGSRCATSVRCQRCSMREKNKMSKARVSVQIEWTQLWGLRCWVGETVAEYEDVRSNFEADER